MSKLDYDTAHDIAQRNPPFYALIMAAMRKADSKNLRKLKHAFPWIWNELQERYNAPGGVLPGDHPAQERRAARAAAAGHLCSGKCCPECHCEGGPPPVDPLTYREPL